MYELLIVLPSREHSVIIGSIILGLVLLALVLMRTHSWRRWGGRAAGKGWIVLPSGSGNESRQMLVDASPVLDRYTKGANAVIVPRALFEHAARPEVSKAERTGTVWLGMLAWIANSEEIHQAGKQDAASEMFLPVARRSKK